MATTGIIAEYNPFHKGHQYQLRKASEFSDRMVVIMSGDFVQRGELSITDKWTRTRVALQNGASIVLMLPTVYSLSGAYGFSYGAVKILNSLGIVDYLYFGAEDSLESLSSVSHMRKEKENEISLLIRENISRGLSYPSAQHNAVASVLGNEASAVMEKPNNILALEYLQALEKLNSEIVPRALERTSVHDSLSENGEYASALSVRNMISENDDRWKNYVPDNAVCEYKDFVFTKDIYRLLIQKLRSPDAGELLLDTPDVGEGLENRITDAAKVSSDYDSLLENIKTRRYTMARIKRILMNFMIGIRNKDILAVGNEPPLVRVLGIRKDSLEMLRELSSNTDINLVTNLPKDNLPRSLEIDLEASNLYGLLCNPPRRYNWDYFEKFIVI